MTEAVRLTSKISEAERAGGFKQTYLDVAMGTIVRGHIHGRFLLDKLGVDAFQLHFAVKLAEFDIYDLKKIIDTFAPKKQSDIDRDLMKFKAMNDAAEALRADARILRDEHSQNASYLNEIKLAANYLAALGMGPDSHGNQSKFFLSQVDLKEWEEMWSEKIDRAKLGLK
jgi:hypothetical protein